MSEEREVSRREALKTLVLGGVLFILPAPIVELVSQVVKGVERRRIPEIPGYNWKEHYWGFAVDINKCIGCGKCVDACKVENKVPRGEMYARTWVERYTIVEGETPEDRKVLVDVISDFGERFEEKKEFRGAPIVRSYFVPKLCNQCANPPCVKVCPVGATFTTKDGIVLVDREWCIGCRYCIVTCPYGARFINPETRTADKCTWCYHRIVKGLKPACVEACPTNARIFGDLKNPKSEISKLLKQKVYNVLKPYYNTKPRVFYLNGIPEEVR